MRKKYFGIWQRPAIPWKLECEWNGTPRSEAIEKFVFDIETDNITIQKTYNLTITGSAIIGFFGFAGFAFFGLPIVCCVGQEDPSVALTE